MKLKIQSGDLIFVSDIQTDFSKAINDVTTDAVRQYTHIAIVEKVGDSSFVIHASPQNGVERIALKEFICQYNPDSVVLDVYRLSSVDIDYSRVIQQAKRYIGLPYNHSFILSDTAQYCSELIFNAFDGFNVFSVEPMTFIDKNTGEFHATWASYFKSRGEDVPEGSLGCNPNGLAAHKDLKFIASATCFDVANPELYTINKN